MLHPEDYKLLGVKCLKGYRNALWMGSSTDLLQKDAILGQMLSILHIDIETGKAEPIVTLLSYGKN